MKLQKEIQETTLSLYEAIWGIGVLALKRILEDGANPNAFSQRDLDRYFVKTVPLSEAAVRGYLESVQVLIDAGADIQHLNHLNWNALHFAAYHSDSPETCLLLIQMGIDPSIKTQHGQTALELAIQRGKVNSAVMIEGAIKAQWEQEQIEVCLAKPSQKDEKQKDEKQQDEKQQDEKDNLHTSEASKNTRTRPLSL